MSEKKPRDYWSDCGQIFFEGGEGYGLTATLQTVCLGKEDDIKKFFETGELNNKLIPIQRGVLAGILDYRKEEGYGQPDTSGAGMERATNNGVVRGKQKAVRQLTPNKGFPLRSAN